MSVTSALPPAEYVFDTFALLALLQNEPGATRVRDLLETASRGEVVCRLSAINAGAVLYIVERRDGPAGARQFLATLLRAPIVIADVTWERVLAAAHIKAQNALSYADAFAIALAREYGATLLTGDPEFQGVAHLATVEWLNR